VTDTPLAIEIDAHPQSRVRNSQPHGIGRVASRDNSGAWSNLGRNVVFAGPDLRPRAVFDESVFAEDEPSQYDLDIHAVLDVDGADLVVVLNHYGMLRGFRRSEIDHPGPLRRVAPVWTRNFVADVERAVVVAGRLVGSRPRSGRAAGLLVSESLHGRSLDADLAVTVALEDWEMVTALAAVPGPAGGRLVVGGNGRVAMVTLADGHVGAVRWDVTVDFEPASLLWDGVLLWAAGSEPGADVDDYDWEARRGGGFAALDPEDGHRVVAGRFAADLGWGNGGTPLALGPGILCGIGRRGELHLFDRRDGSCVGATAPLADRSLGIAHGAAIGDHLVFGFNRGGYRLWAVPFAAVQRLRHTA
jgi:hypothetical protein